MNKHISTAASALALVSAIGLAYAQTDPGPVVTDTTAQMQQPQDQTTPPVAEPAASAGATETGIPASTAETTAAPSTMTTYPADAPMSTERAPQADRN